MAREKPKFGPAVTEDRILRYTSVSTLQSADEEGTEGGCWRKFFGEKVLGWPRVESKGQKIGVEKHAEIEQYYTSSGGDARTSLARASAHLLPKRGPDIFIEQEFGASVEEEFITESLKTESDEVKVASLQRRLEEVRAQLALPGGRVPLLAGGLRMVGFIDMRHQRGEYIDENGTLRREDPSLGLVSEVIDHKFLASIPKYHKSGPQLAETIQMPMYLIRAADILPGIRYGRVSHVTTQTRGAISARKSTILLPVDEVRKRAQRRVDALVDEMRHVAQKGGIEDVRPNYNACEKFGGCAHAKSGICPRGGMTIYHAFGVNEGDPMSLGLFGSANDPPPVSDVRSCGAPGCGVGCDPGFIAPGIPCPACRGKGADGLLPVLPIDSPPSTPLEDAAPLSEEARAEISDPELRARVEAHARLSAEARAKEAESKVATGAKKVSSMCPGGKQKVRLAVVKKRGNKAVCPVCGEERAVKPAEDGSAQIPAHHRKPEAAIPTIPAIPVLPAEAPPLPSGIPALPTTRKQLSLEVSPSWFIDGAITLSRDALAEAGFKVGDKVSIVLA